jgi:HlyD family secretion protein
VVVDRAVNVGQTVAASFSSPTLYTIANDLSKMQVLATVDESDIGDVSIGQKATFSVEAYPDETFEGTISQIRLAPVSVQNVVNYTVVIDVDNKNLALMPGMTATVKIALQSDGQVLRVPNLALRFQPPADAIDTTAMQALRMSYSRRGNNAGEAGSVTAPDTAISPRTAQRGEQTLLQKSLQKPRQETQFGITTRYPEYEKSTYVPRGPSARARLWIVNSRGLLEPLFVRTGISDGRFTEISGRTLTVGERIVLGATSNAVADGGSVSSPFMGRGGNQRFGGGFR